MIRKNDRLSLYKIYVPIYIILFGDEDGIGSRVGWIVYPKG